MKFGLFYLPTHLPAERGDAEHIDNIVEQVVYADKIGMHSVWMAEHHFIRHGGICAANYSLLSFLAARTKRIRLGTGATVMPLNDPLRVAEMGATLDQLSKGRFDLGVGRGFLRQEFETFGVDMRDSRERTEEGIDIVKRAWTGKVLNLKPRFRPPIENITVLPRVYQKPHPPIWVACFLSPESFEWTAKEGYGLLYVAYHVDPDAAMEKIGWYRKALPKFGRKPEDHEVNCVYHGFFQDRDDVDALRRIVEKPMLEYSAAGAEAVVKAPDPVAYKNYSAREDYHKQAAFEGFFPGRVLMGGPERVMDRLRVMKRSGITQVSLIVDYGGLKQKDIMGSLEVLGREIMPRVKELDGIKPAN